MAGQVIGKIATDEQTHLLTPTFYAVCTTEASAQTKIAKLVDTNIDSAKFITGMTVSVKFTNINSAVNPQLEIQTSSGIRLLEPKNIVGYEGSALMPTWSSGAVVSLTYDGTRWISSMSLNSISDIVIASPTAPSSTTCILWLDTVRGILNYKENGVWTPVKSVWK